MTEEIYEGEVVDGDLSHIPPMSQYYEEHYEEVAARIADRMSAVFMVIMLLGLCFLVFALLFMDLEALRIALWGH